jgi:TRAP-type C4-dicarboxylate transport system substrate-binding protein
VHGDGVFHMTNKPVKTMADLKGLKLRAPTRMTNKFIAMLGATPVSMPVPQVGDALSKGVIDGAVVPYEVVPAVKIQELVKFHSETDPAQPAFYTSTFIFAMNKARYESLPADLKKVIDANSGIETAAFFGRAMDQGDIGGKGIAEKLGNNIIVLDEAETKRWKDAAAPLIEGWEAEMAGKGKDGKALVTEARALIDKYSAGM